MGGPGYYSVVSGQKKKKKDPAKLRCGNRQKGDLRLLRLTEWGDGLSVRQIRCSRSKTSTHSFKKTSSLNKKSSMSDNNDRTSAEHSERATNKEGVWKNTLTQLPGSGQALNLLTVLERERILNEVFRSQNHHNIKKATPFAREIKK